MPKPPELSSTLVHAQLARAVWRPAWSPDGTQFVVADAAGNIVVFEQRDGRFVKRATLHDPPKVYEPGDPLNYGVAWPSSEHIVSLDRVPPEACCTYQRRSLDLSVTAVVPSRDNYRIASGGNGMWVVTARGDAVDVVKVPGLDTLLAPTIGTLDLPDPGIFALAADPRGNVLAASSDGGSEESHDVDKYVMHGDPRTDVVDVATKQTIAMIPELAYALAFDPWRQQLVLVSRYGKGVKCYSYAGVPVRELPTPPERVGTAAVTQDWIITSSNEDGALSFWAADSLELVATVPSPDHSKTDWIVPSPDGTTFLTQAADHTVRIWDIDSAKLTITREEIALWRRTVEAPTDVAALEAYRDWLLKHDLRRGRLLRTRMRTTAPWRDLARNHYNLEKQAWITALGIEGCEEIDFEPLPQRLHMNARRIESLGRVLDHLPFLHINLDFYDVGPTEAVLASIFASPAVAKIRHLSFRAYSDEMDPDENCQAVLRTHYGDRVFVALCASPNITQLATLWILDEQVGGGCASALAAIPFTQLRELRISREPIGDAGAAALANSPFLASLRGLALTGCNLGDAGALALASSPYLEQLEKLEVSGNNVTAVGEAALRSSKHLPALRSIVGIRS